MIWRILGKQDGSYENETKHTPGVLGKLVPKMPTHQVFTGHNLAVTAVTKNRASDGVW
jgi:hypothetical protein